jgi:hypothetical protein
MDCNRHSLTATPDAATVGATRHAESRINPMSLKPQLLLGILAWGAAAYGLTVLGVLPDEALGDLGHKLCGPWG